VKDRDKQRLSTDLIRICDQIGILPNERPRLVTNRKEMHDIKLNDPHCYKSGNPIADKRTGGYGQCSYSLRTVFVDAAPRHYQRITYHGRKAKRYRIIRRVKATYKDKLHVLIEELVHYRFAYLQEGRNLEKRIQEVLRGRTFEQKHIHLFSGRPKSYRALIEGKEERVER
jgi:hypothetical protein